LEVLYEAYPYPPAGSGKRWRKREARLEEEGAALARTLLAHAPELEGGELLDAGCGTGGKLLGLARALPKARLTGVDLSRASLAIAGVRMEKAGIENVTLRHGRLDQGEGPAEIGRFHAVVSDGVIHHMPDPKAALQGLCRAVRPKGVLYVTAFSRTGRPREARIREMLRIAGLASGDFPSGLAAARALLALPELVSPRHAVYYEEDAFLADAFLNPREAWVDLTWFVRNLESEGLRFLTWPAGEKYLPKLSAVLEGLPPKDRDHATLLHLVELWKCPAMIGALAKRP
jgi:SAM-dependent methyltransferase